MREIEETLDELGCSLRERRCWACGGDVGELGRKQGEETLAALRDALAACEEPD